MSVVLLCMSAHANGELIFAGHGFAIELADGWVISDAAPLYEKYLSANEKAFGEEAAKQLRASTGVVFKANRGSVGSDDALYTCIAARNIADLGTLTDAQSTSLIEEMASNSYRALAAKGLNVTTPVLGNGNGIEYSAHKLIQEEGEHITEYRLFITAANVVICVGGGLSEYREDIVFMHESIRKAGAVKP